MLTKKLLLRTYDAELHDAYVKGMEHAYEIACGTGGLKELSDEIEIESRVQMALCGG